MDFRHIVYEQDDAVALIRMVDPTTLNAASFAMVAELNEALDLAAKEARVVILTGTGRGFCSGANLSFDVDPGAQDYDAGRGLELLFNPLMRRLRDLPIPLITAVNGIAAGGGCSLALAGDVIIASAGASFLLPSSRIGLVPDCGAAYLLTQSIGRVRTMQMMLLGERVDSARAMSWGMVTDVVPDSELIVRSKQTAQGLANGPASLALIRRACWMALEAGFEEQLLTERAMQRAAGQTADHLEGVNAFLQKRTAKFEGR